MTPRVLIGEYLFISFFRACAESLASANASVQFPELLRIHDFKRLHGWKRGPGRGPRLARYNSWLVEHGNPFTDRRIWWAKPTRG